MKKYRKKMPVKMSVFGYIKIFSTFQTIVNKKVAE